MSGFYQEKYEPALFTDMVGIIIQYGNPGGFVTKVLELWQIADPGNRRHVEDLVLFVFDKYHLEDLYKEILRSNESAAKASHEFLGSINGHPDYLPSM